ncbi:hypothetical protein MAP00_002378 [Monascus purpureus]|nr:hypothetical protein MAP00_002378 [Monascus purpureus]
MQAEVSGDFIRKVPNAEEERGEILVMVLASDSTRDQVRDIVQGYLHNQVRMSVLDFQPA